MKLIIFFLLALVAVLTLLLLRKYTRLEFVGHARCYLELGLFVWGLLAHWSVYGRSHSRMPRFMPGQCCRRISKISFRQISLH